MTTTGGHSEAWKQWLSLEPLERYKHDTRSSVWRVRGVPEDDVVIKRFEYNPLRQRLAMLAGLHPAQAEARKAAALEKAGVPVVRVIGQHAQAAGACGLGAKVHLATRWQGVSLQQVLRGDGCGVSCEEKLVLLQAVGALAAAMLQAGWVFRDFKTSNLLVDEQRQPRLIDVGSARYVGPVHNSYAPARAWRMLWMLDHTLAQDGCDEAQRVACLAQPLAIISPLPARLAFAALQRDVAV